MSPLVLLSLCLGAILARTGAISVHTIDPSQNTFSLPVTYSMAAPSSSSSGQYSASLSAMSPQTGATERSTQAPKKSAVLHHFKTIRGSSTTPSEEVTTQDGPKYSSSYNSQRVQLQVEPHTYPASLQDEKSLMQKQQSYQSLHDYQTLNQQSYQNLASLKDEQSQLGESAGGQQGYQQPSRDYQQYLQISQQAYQDFQKQQKEYQSYQQVVQQAKNQYQGHQQDSQDTQGYQQNQDKYQYQSNQQDAQEKQGHQNTRGQQKEQYQDKHQYQGYQQASQQEKPYQGYQQQTQQDKPFQGYQQTPQQQTTYQQSTQQWTGQSDNKKDSQSHKQKPADYQPNVLSYQNAQAQLPSAEVSQNEVPHGSSQIPNALSIEEAVAAAAAVTQMPVLTPEQKQQLLQQQQLQIQQQQHELLLQQQGYQVPQQTTAAYERFYEAVAATAKTPDPRINTTPRTHYAYKPQTAHKAGSVLQHYKQTKPASPASLMAAAAQYYKTHPSAYYGDAASFYAAYPKLARPPYRRVARPHAHPYAHAHAHAHAQPYAHAHPYTRVHAQPHAHAQTHKHRVGADPNVQHFFHGPYTMESGLPQAPEPATSWIDHVIAPVKREDNLLSGIGSPAGSSTALLNGLLVPIVLLGLSIPALGFAYSYLSRRREFGNDVAHFMENLRPTEETMEYYLNALQTAVECYQDPKLHNC